MIVDKIGDIEEIMMDFGVSVGEMGSNVFVFDVVGSKVSGWFIVNMVIVLDECEEVMWGCLCFELGEEFDFFLD